MKKFLSLIFSLNFIFLSGCGGIYANFRELEQIRVIQTMGLDYIPGGVQLTLSSANVENPEEKALCLSGTGSSISQALENIRKQSTQDDLFLSHVKQILIGEAGARHDMESYFSYICRSQDLRIDIPVFIVKDKTAKETMCGSGSSNKGISEIFQALENEQHMSRLISAAEAIKNLDKNGATLMSLVKYSPASDSPDEKGDKIMTASLCGYAVIRENKLCGYIDSENALGADFLLNRVGISDIILSDNEGNPISMEISSGSSSIEAEFTGNELSGINVNAEVRATVLEMQENQTLLMDELSDFLVSKLEEYVLSRISYVLQLQRKLNCDFLGLGSEINISEPGKFQSMSQSFSEILPKLKMNISVSGELCHSKDVKEGRF